MKWTIRIAWLLFSCHLQAQNGALLDPDLEESLPARIEIRSAGRFNLSSSLSALHPGQLRDGIQPDSADHGIPPDLKKDLEYFGKYYPESGMEDSLSGSGLKSFKANFFRSGHFYYESGDAFFFRINPLLEIKAGADSKGNLLFTNRRGIHVQAGIGSRIRFYSALTENQLAPGDQVREYVDQNLGLPGAVFLKDFSADWLKNRPAWDFLTAEGVLDVRTGKYFHFSFGHGRQRTGDGLRSLFLSDFSAPRFFLQMDARISRFAYRSVWSELNAETRYRNGTDRLLDKKYMAHHYLEAKLSQRWKVGIMESVIFARDRGFEWQYLNPVILFRSVEQGLGSPDNAFMGLSSSYILGKNCKLYAQWLIDEFLFRRLTGKPGGWWGNKYGIQTGIACANLAGIPRLDLILEYNTVRPFTYAYQDSTGNYTHAHQALAHPLGANFRELLLKLKYPIGTKWELDFNLMYFFRGRDSDERNFGGNILRDYRSRISDFGNTTAQGQREEVLFQTLYLSYRIWDRCYLDLDLLWRKNMNSADRDQLWFMTGIRMNLDRQSRRLFF